MTDDLTPVQPRRSRSRFYVTTAVAAALIVGGFGGAFASRAYHRWQPQSVLLLQPGAIGQLKPDTVVAAKGNVAEVYGNKFILQDDSGRTLVDTGPRGDRAPVARQGDTLTVQGRFDRGVIHAQVIVRPDGKAEAFGPPNGPHGPRGPHGFDGPRGPGAGMAPPPPPPPAPAPGATPPAPPPQ